MSKKSVNRDYETRLNSAAEFEIRAGEGDARPTIVGYAALYDVESEPIFDFVEKIEKGAFAQSMGGDVRALFNHDRNLILGRTVSKTLRLTDDNRGLQVEIDPPDTQYANDLIVAMRRGDITQMSFGFRTRKDRWEDLDGKIVRTLVEVDLFDVSPVTFAAYPQTDVAVRSLEAWKAETAPTPPDYSIERRKLDLIEHS